MNALQNMFSQNLIKNGENKKKVSFSTTVGSSEQKGPSPLSKSTTLKRSQKQYPSEEDSQVNGDEFDKFFTLFMANYAEEGYVSVNQNQEQGKKVIHVMDNREAFAQSKKVFQ